MAGEQWQLEQEAAERYEACQVPALMAVWARHTVAAAGVHAGDRVLDVACGTGVVARVASDRVRPNGHVAGSDLNPGMLTVARRLYPQIEWRQADAAALPFLDGSFDCVLCQFGLMFFPDRQAGLREMRRVLRPNGRVAITTWGAIDVSPPYVIEVEIIAPLAGLDAAPILLAPFALSDPAELERLLLTAGFEDVAIETIREAANYPDIDAFLEAEFDATPLGMQLLNRGANIYQQARAAMRDAMAPFASSSGVTFPIQAHVATARRS